jgi:catechol 2,3-dioxygenase-like lactoylglutathione lyase family enzyme
MFALILLAAVGCGDDSGAATNPVGMAGTSSAPGGSAAPATPAAGRSGSATGIAGVSAAGARAVGSGGTRASAAGTSAAGVAGSAASGASGSPSAAGTGADPGAAGSGPLAGAPAIDPADVPAPVTTAITWGFGIGITDVPAAVKFYTEVMKMTVEKENVVRDDRTETVLYATEAKRGARVILMKYNDGRMTRNVTAKFVWQASDTAGVNRAAMMHPDFVSRLNAGGLVQFDGPETYIQEVGGIFDTEGGNISVPYLIAMGFSVSDLAKARAFYMGLGMEEETLGTFSVTDATGSGSITEYTEIHRGGPGLVVQAWTPMRNSKDNPVKIVNMVPDAQAYADKLVAAGGTIVTPAARTPVYDNRLLIVGKDPDGYLIEIVQ